MTERWRCFVAVPLPETLRAALGASVATWQSRPDLRDLRWTDPDGWHLTLAFLGSVDPADVPAIAERVGGAVAECDASAHATGGLGGFPSAGRARVAWYGVADPERRLRSLAAAIRGALGLATDDPFRPHVTLARARSDAVSLRDWIAEAADAAPAGHLRVDGVELMRSHLGRGPARYETLAALPLGMPARAVNA